MAKCLFCSKAAKDPDPLCPSCRATRDWQDADLAQGFDELRVRAGL